MIVRCLIVPLCCAILLCVSAASAQDSRPNGGPPEATERSAAPIRMQRSNGSLLKASLAARPDPAQAPLEAVSYFAVPKPEPRTLKKHDLVTIIVREESTFKAQGNTDLKKEAAFLAQLNEFIRINSSLNLEPAIETPLSIDINGRRNFKGQGTVDRSDRFTTRVTAEIIDVKPNGTVVLQARSRTKIDEEEQIMILSGTCRVEDVTADNTVLSSQLFDQDVTKIHKGAVRDTTRRGLIPKLLDVLNPF